ncbi:MAG: DUF5681 domain-containing protein [Gammaproteobacteria bacterium]|nr:DUF5681 domain-containing protein [Gammaproteobacteria bacterium]
MVWKKGQSGNPKGRTPGTGKVAQMRNQLEGHLPEVLETIALKAELGDMTAARLLLDRVFPALRPVEVPVTFPTGNSLTDTGAAVLKTAGEGEIPASQAAQLLTALGALARVKEMDELAERLARLEEQVGDVQKAG